MPTSDQPKLSLLRLPTPVLDVREVWPSEPADFTPWLAGHLEILEQLGLGPLELVDTEVAIPGTGRALDILARLETGETVAIENQFSKVDHDHFTRGLAYAVGLHVAALILIAENHLEEFRAVADYLNRVTERSGTEERIGIYLLALAVDRVEEYYVPRLSVVSQPNSWLVAAAAAQPAPGVASIEDFLAKVPPNAQLEMKAVTDWWLNHHVGGIRYGAQNAISLDRPHPAKPNRPLSHLLLNRNGTYTVQRGYLREAGVVPASLDDEFDTFVHEVFPDAVWAGKHYYLNSSGPPQLAAVQNLVAWLDNLSSDKPNILEPSEPVVATYQSPPDTKH